MSDLFSKTPSEAGFEQIEQTAARIRLQAVEPEDVNRFVASLVGDLRATSGRNHPSATIRRSVLAIAAVLMLSVTLLLTPLSGTQSLFAQVQAEVSRTRTARFVYMLDRDGLQDEIRRMELVLKEAELVLKTADAAEAERIKAIQERVTRRLPVFKEKLKSGELMEESIVEILGASRQRRTSDGIHGRSVMISDAKRGQSINLLPDDKQCTVFKPETGGSQKSPAPGPDPDLYSELANIDTRSLIQSGERTVDGEKLVGFHKVEDDGRGIWTRSYWVNPLSKLPKLIETTWRGRNGVISTWTRAKIEFGIQLDESNFSVDPPEGYRVTEGSFVSVEPSATK